MNQLILGLIIGVAITLILDFLVSTISGVYLMDKIVIFDLILVPISFLCKKFVFIFSPFWHPIVSIWMFNHNMSPWNISISKLLALDEDVFRDFLKVVPKKYIEKWKKAYNREVNRQVFDV